MKLEKKKETYEFNIYILKNEIIRLLITRKEKKQIFEIINSLLQIITMMKIEVIFNESLCID